MNWGKFGNEAFQKPEFSMSVMNSEKLENIRSPILTFQISNIKFMDEFGKRMS